MTMIKQYPKRIIAVAVAIMLLLGTLFTGAVSATAASLTDGLTVVAASSQNGCGASYKKYSTVTNITGGGIKYETVYSEGSIGAVANGALAPYVHGTSNNESTGAFPGDGFRLQFNNYTTSAEYSSYSSYQKFIVGFAQQVVTNASNHCRLSTGVGAVMFDTSAGTLSLVVGKGGVNTYDVVHTIATDDALKYANFTGKAFTLDFAAGSNNSIDVAVTVGDEYIYGNIPSDKWEKIDSAKRPGNTAVNNSWFFISSAPVSDGVGDALSHTTLEYYGFKKGVTVTKPVVPLTTGLTNIATSTTKVDFERDGQKPTLTDITGGGVTIAYPTGTSGAQNNSTQPYVHNVSYGPTFTTKVTMQFDNFVVDTANAKADKAGYKELEIVLGSSITKGDYYYRLTGNAAGIVVNAKDGKLLFVKGKSNGAAPYEIIQTLATDDALKYENLTGKDFTVTIEPITTAQLEVTVTIEGTKNVSGIITAPSWNKELTLAAGHTGGLDKLPTTETYIAVCGTTSNVAENNQPFSIDYYGFKTETVNPPVDSSKDYVSHLDKIATTSTNGYSHSTAKTFYSDILGGGVKYAPTSLSAYNPYIHNVNIGDLTTGNFLLQFNDYKSNCTDANAAGYRVFAIGLFRTSTSGDNYRKLIINGCVGLKFDTVNGKVDLVQANASNSQNTVCNIITNDALKYDSISEKPFTVEWISGNPNITIRVTIDNGDDAEDTVVSGTLPLATYTGTTYPLNTGTGYFAVTGIDNVGNNGNSWSIEYYGFASLGQNPSVSGLTEGLTDTAEVAENMMSRKDLITQNDLMGGGVALSWTNYAGYAPYCYNVNMGPFPNDGIRLQFAGYEIDSSTVNTVDGYGQIAIVLSSTTVNDGTKPKSKSPILMIDTNNGTLSLVKMKDDSCGATCNPEVVETIITNDILKYANIKNKPFSITIQTAADDNYTVTVDVNGTKAAGTMTKSKFTAFVNAPNSLTTYVGIGGFTNGAANKFSLEFYGYEAVKIKAPEIDVSQLTETANSTVDLYPRPALKEVTDLENGGVSINFTSSNGGYVPYSYGVNLGKFPGDDGFKLQFSNYINIASKNEANADYYGQIAIVLSNTNLQDRTKTKKEVAFLQIDTVNGKLLLRYCNNGNWGNPEANVTELGFTTVAELLTSDLLKYENFSRKAFSLTFKNSTTSEGDVDITIEVGGDGNTVKGETVTAVLDMDLFNSITYHAGTSTYVSVGGFDNDANVINPFYVEFYGYQNFGVRRQDVLVKGDATAVNAAIAALPATATEADAEAILNAKAKYDALTDKSGVTGADKLTTLMSELNALRNASKIKPTSTYIAREADASLSYAEFGNPHARTLFSKETDNGFKVEWRGTTNGVSGHETLMSQAIYGAYALDGMRVHIDDYTFDATKGSDFWVQFTSGDYDEFWNISGDTADKMIAVHLGLQKGRLEINGVGAVNTWIAGDTSLLLRDNLKDKDFIIEWRKQTNGDYICYITIGEQVVAFTLTAEELAKMPNFDPEEVRVIIGNADTKAIFSMEVTGIYSAIDSKAQTVIDLIDKLPATVTSAANVSAVEAAVAAYSALTVSQKEQIHNVDTLTAARAAVRKYEGVDEKGRDKDGYYVPSALEDVYGDTAESSAYASVKDSPLGGLRYEWGGEGYGKKNCFNDYYVIDGISVRFDNWKYSNDGAFIVGFENSSQECKVFDRKQFDTRNGIWLTIGRNNTVYSTYANKDVTGVFPLFEANELLSAQNLMNKEFFVSWKVLYSDTGATNLQVTFTVDGKDFTYTYDDEFMKALDLMDIEDIQVVTHCISGNSHDGSYTPRTQILTSASIDITGLKYEEFSSAQKNSIQEVIDAIDTLPEKASADIAEDINDIWKMYYQLSFKEMRLAVTNHSKLIKLYNELFDMQLADGTMYLTEEDEEEDEVDEDDYEDDYDWTVEDEDDYDAEYEDEPDDTEADADADTSDETEDTSKKPTKVSKDEDDSSFPWIIVVIGGIILLAIIAIIIILLVRRNKEKEGK